MVLEYDGNNVTSWEGEGLRNDRLLQSDESSMVCLAQQNGIAVVMQLNGKHGKQGRPKRRTDSSTTASSTSSTTQPCGMCAPTSKQLERRSATPQVFLKHESGGTSKELEDLSDEEPSTCLMTQRRRGRDGPSVTWLIKEA